jgi:ketosteroid isomerase-like protein
MWQVVASFLLFQAFLNFGAGQTTTTPQRSPYRGLTAGPLAQEVLEAKRQYDDAQLKNDGAWFERMFADDYVFIMPDSTVVSKADFINDLQTHDLRWESVTAKDVQVRVYGDTAVVTGRFFGKGHFKGSVLDERQRFTSVWIKRNGQLRCITEHASNLGPSER